MNIEEGREIIYIIGQKSLKVTHEYKEKLKEM